MKTEELLRYRSMYRAMRARFGVLLIEYGYPGAPSMRRRADREVRGGVQEGQKAAAERARRAGGL